MDLDTDVLLLVGLAVLVGAAVQGCVGLGLGLVVDNWLGTTPIFILVGMVLGIATAMYTIWDVARDNMRK